MKKPVIEYPCTWSYRVIGSDSTLMMKEIPARLGDIQHTITPANLSRKGNYCSINVEAIVQTESERLSIIPLLRSIPEVKMVL